MYLNCLRRIYFSQNINDKTIFSRFCIYPICKGDNDLKMKGIYGLKEALVGEYDFLRRTEGYKGLLTE